MNNECNHVEKFSETHITTKKKADSKKGRCQTHTAFIRGYNREGESKAEDRKEPQHGVADSSVSTLCVAGKRRLANY